MTRVEILNQLGKKGLMIGPMKIDRKPSGLNRDDIPDWTAFCDDVDKVLKAGTTQTRIYKFGTIALLAVLFVTLTIGSQAEWLLDFNYFWIISCSVLLLNFALYMKVMKSINQVMNELRVLLESKGSNRISYELKDERMSVFIKQFFIVVNGANNSEDVEAPPPPVFNSELTPSVRSMMGTDASTVSTSTRSSTKNVFNTSNVYSEPPPSTMSSPYTSTQSNNENSTTANNNAGTGTTSIFDQLNSGA